MTSPTSADPRPPTLDLAAARTAIADGHVDLVTSDVFDTVVWRPVAQPHHLFLRLAARLRAAGQLPDHFDDQTFATGRRWAEERARRAALAEHGTPECTLEEIWDEVPSRWWTGEPFDGPAVELQVEGDVLHLHRATVELFDLARGHGVPVVLVSDTYFSVGQLRSLLGRAGLDLDGIDVVTSSAGRRNKWEGMLDDVIGERGVEPGRVLHLGDQPVADVVVANRAGAQVCHVDVHPDDDAVASAHAPWQRWSNAAGTDAGRSAVVRSTLVTAGADRTADPSYQFGVAVAGPVMAGFAGWASATATELGAGALHCLLREGGRIAELIDLIHPEGPPRVLVHASRWGIMRAAVIEGDPIELERALARRHDMRADHVTQAFGCDRDLVAEVIGGDVIPRTARADAYDAIAEHDELRAAIVTESARLRRGVVTYLDRTLRLDDGPLVFCDIGWGGTIQEGLTDILSDAGIDREVVGLYALLSPPGERRAGLGARMLGYLPTVGAHGSATPHAEVVIRHPEFLERINTPALGTLLGFDDGGEPLTQPDDHDDIGPSLAAAQRGVADFCRTLAEMVLDPADPAGELHRREWFHDPDLAATALEGLARVIRAPDPRLADALGTWEHDDVGGTAAEALANADLVRWVPFFNAVDAAEITMHDAFWVPGVASSARSGLAHQLAALAGGAHPDALCPPNPTGTARIAVFAPGSTLATAQTELVPRLGNAGWTLLQLVGPITGLRSVRIDPGDSDLLVDVGDVQIELSVADAGGDERAVLLVDGAAHLRATARWVDGRWLDGHRGVAARGGHLLVDVPAELAASVRTVSVSIGMRTWAIEPTALATLAPRWRRRLDPLRHRAESRLRRR